MSRLWFSGISTLCVVAALSTQACGQAVVMPACAPGHPFFCVDAAGFLVKGSPVLEVYLEICNDALQFVKTGGEYRASGDVTAVLYDRSGKQVAGDTYRVVLSTPRYGQTTSIDSCTTVVLSFKAAPGDYKLGVTLADRDSKGKSMIEAYTTVPDFSGSPALSDIGFITPREGSSLPRRPGFQPNVRRSYGDIGVGIPFHFEIYNEKADSLDLAYAVSGGDDRRVWSDTVRIATPGPQGVNGRIPLDELANGPYRLQIAILDDEGSVEASRSGDFEINREEFYLGKNVDDAVALLTYVAPSGFINAFVKADIEERKKLWENFWREKDPSPATPRNEYYEEHVRRFRYANEHFRAGLTEGWRTDRGRIYIVEGPPDEVDSYSMEVDRNPAEIWYYFSNGKRYVFVDETGFGDYVLVSIE
jgi:GWxTD domain-containing protein